MTRRRPALTAEAVRQHADLVEQLSREQFLTTEEVAIITRCSPSHVRRACSAGTLVGTRLGSRQWRVSPNEVRRWMAAAAPAVVARPRRVS